MRNKLAETQQAFNHKVFIILNKTVYEQSKLSKQHELLAAAVRSPEALTFLLDKNKTCELADVGPTDCQTAKDRPAD